MRTLEVLAARRDTHLARAETLRNEGYALAEKKFNELKAYYDSAFEAMVNRANKEYDEGKAIIEKHIANPPLQYISRQKARIGGKQKQDKELNAAYKKAVAEAKEKGEPIPDPQAFASVWLKDHPLSKVVATADSKKRVRIPIAERPGNQVDPEVKSTPQPIPSNTEPEVEEVEPEKKETKAEKKEREEEEKRVSFFSAIDGLVEEEEDDWSDIDEEELKKAKAELAQRYKKPSSVQESTEEKKEQEVPAVPEVLETEVKVDQEEKKEKVQQNQVVQETEEEELARLRMEETERRRQEAEAARARAERLRRTLKEIGEYDETVELEKQRYLEQEETARRRMEEDRKALLYRPQPIEVPELPKVISNTKFKKPMKTVVRNYVSAVV